MDFDKPKVYGDTSITDGLVNSAKSANSVIRVYIVNSVSSYSAVLPQSPMVFLEKKNEEKNAGLVGDGIP